MSGRWWKNAQKSTRLAIFALLWTLSTNNSQLLAEDQAKHNSYPATPVVVPPLGESASPTVAPSYKQGTTNGGAATVPAFAPSLAPSKQFSYGSAKTSTNAIPENVRRLIGPGHLPSAMPNPATMPFQGGQSAQDAEHQTVLSNMRKAGYSESRIESLQPYIHQTEPAGATYRMVNGIRVRNDNMTAGEALNNITTNGVMNTPIHSDPRYYQPGTYGYYRGMGGTKNFDQWSKGQR